MLPDLINSYGNEWPQGKWEYSTAQLVAYKKKEYRQQEGGTPK